MEIKINDVILLTEKIQSNEMLVELNGIKIPEHCFLFFNSNYSKKIGECNNIRISDKKLIGDLTLKKINKKYFDGDNGISIYLMFEDCNKKTDCLIVKKSVLLGISINKLPLDENTIFKNQLKNNILL